MLTQVAILLGGLLLLLAGGDTLIRGASALAARLGVSPLVVGLTVVAFGTSAPELVVSLLAALEGDAGIAFGNVVGSNIANVSLLLGATALVRPLVVQSSLVTREIPMMILASAAVVVLCLDRTLAGQPVDLVQRGDGLVLLLFFAVFLYATIGDVARARRSDPLLEETASLTPVAHPVRQMPSMLALVLGGLVGLALGGHLVVGSASALAVGLGVPPVVVGATVVATGTSLPELATSVLAARRGQSDLAVGNVVGSNLFNLLFVLGATATVAPVSLPVGAGVDLAFLLGLAVLVLPVAVTHRHTITRLEGLGLVAVYLGFLGWQVLR